MAPAAAGVAAPRAASGGKSDSQRAAAAAKAETQKKYAELSRKQAQKYKASDNSVEVIRLRVRQEMKLEEEAVKARVEKELNEKEAADRAVRAVSRAESAALAREARAVYAAALAEDVDEAEPVASVLPAGRGGRTGSANGVRGPRPARQAADTGRAHTTGRLHPAAGTPAPTTLPANIGREASLSGGVPRRQLGRPRETPFSAMSSMDSAPHTAQTPEEPLTQVQQRRPSAIPAPGSRRHSNSRERQGGAAAQGRSGGQIDACTDRHGCTNSQGGSTWHTTKITNTSLTAHTAHTASTPNTAHTFCMDAAPSADAPRSCAQAAQAAQVQMQFGGWASGQSARATAAAGLSGDGVPRWRHGEADGAAAEARSVALARTLLEREERKKETEAELKELERRMEARRAPVAPKPMAAQPAVPAEQRKSLFSWDPSQLTTDTANAMAAARAAAAPPRAASKSDAAQAAWQWAQQRAQPPTHAPDTIDEE